MTDVAREKYVRLMTQIEDLEDRVLAMEESLQTMDESSNPGDSEVARQEFHDLREELALKRSELARISDGCGKPHP